MVVLAALSGWFVRGISLDDVPDPSPAPRAAPVIVQDAVVAEPVPVVHHAASDTRFVGQRNLFAYRVHERPIAARPIVHPAPAMIAMPVATIAPTPEPRPFPYRYIRTFGPRHTPVAAFSRDGEVLTVRAGERVGDFVLHSIGIESVEVQSTDGTRRIPLGR